MSVEELRGGRYVTVERARTAAGGAYDVTLPGPGRYRIAYGGITGPSIAVR